MGVIEPGELDHLEQAAVAASVQPVFPFDFVKERGELPLTPFGILIITRQNGYKGRGSPDRVIEFFGDVLPGAQVVFVLLDFAVARQPALQLLGQFLLERAHPILILVRIAEKQVVLDWPRKKRHTIQRDRKVYLSYHLKTVSDLRTRNWPTRPAPAPAMWSIPLCR